MSIKTAISKLNDVLTSADILLEKSYENDKTETLDIAHTSVLNQATLSLIQGGTKERLLASAVFLVPTKSHTLRNVLSTTLAVVTIRRMGWKKSFQQNVLVCVPSYAKLVMKTFENR